MGDCAVLHRDVYITEVGHSDLQASGNLELPLHLGVSQTDVEGGFAKGENDRRTENNSGTFEDHVARWIFCSVLVRSFC